MHGVAANGGQVGCGYIRRSVAVLGTLGRQASDDPIKHTSRRICTWEWGDRRHNMPLNDSVYIGIVERRMTCYRLKEHDPEGVQIGRGAWRRTLGAFRREVVRRGDERRRIHTFGARNTEVEQDRRAVIFDQDILRLHIAVDVATAMHVAKRSSNTAHHLRRTQRGHWEEFVERPAGQELLDEVGCGRILAGIEGADDIRVNDLRSDLALAQEPLTRGHIGCKVRPEDLDCHLAPEPLIMSTIYCAHTAVAHERFNLIPSAEYCSRL
jgi:hypothetical protein